MTDPFYSKLRVLRNKFSETWRRYLLQTPEKRNEKRSL